VHVARVEIDLTAPGAGRHAAELARGKLSVMGAARAVGDTCELVIRGHRAIEVHAQVEEASEDGMVVALPLDVELLERLVAIASSAPRLGGGCADTHTGTDTDRDADDLGAAGDGRDDDDHDNDGDPAAGDATPGGAHGGARRDRAKNVYQRLRGLTLIAQYRLARQGELHERIALERMYRNQVWEPLLRNPRITPPEVARIARMGNLQRPQLEQICGNATWLNVPEVRRALLSNPRLGADAIPRVLRQLPAHELKLVPAQTAYPYAVRECARRLLRAMTP
jgi:hypothetical protein